MTAAQDNNQEQGFKEAFRQFVEAQLFGREPDVEELVKNYPDFEDQIRQKLAKFQKVDSLFGSIVRADESDFGDPAAGYDLVGQKVENYKVVERIGEGGMGIVYLAEQQGSIRRRVALKVIKPGMDSERVLARFEIERQALALLDHPNIAHVHDAGTTVNGRPYFVMEYVKGLPITEYCDHRMLSVEERLQLFQQVCQAVHHAHQKGIIHRDVKPSNILVTTQDDQAVPKIIDFGIAKAIAQPLTERTLYTEQGQLLGTPEYMSPEQADMSVEDIDTRSDIYSLGVILYELLTGFLPFDSAIFRAGGIDHIRKVIRETDPKTPSTRLTSLGDEAREVAQKRQTEVGTLAKRLHKELEWIPLMAMRKDRTRRYRSASEFADDIENYLTGAPLVAGPLSKAYRLRKFVRRHQAFAVGAAAVLVVLVAGIVVSMLLAIRAERALSRESRARAEAQAITDFLTEDVLGSANRVMGRDATAIDLLDAASAELDEGAFRNQPLTELLVRYRLGNLIKDLGYSKKAIPYLERVQEIYLEHGVPEGLSSGLIMNYLGLAYLRSGEWEKAESLFQTIIEKRERTDHIYTALYPWVKFKFAEICRMQARYDQSERILLEMMNPQFRKGQGLPTRSIVMCMCDLAETYRAQGRYNESEEMYIEAEDVIQRDDVDVTTFSPSPSMGLAKLYMDLGRYKKAEELYRGEIERVPRERPGKDHVDTVAAMNGLAVVLTMQRDFHEAQRLFEEVWKVRRERWSDDHPDTLATMKDFGVLRREQKEYEKAESLLGQALKGRQSKLGIDHPACFETLYELAVLYKEQGDYDRAEPLFLKAVEGRRLKLGDTHPHTLESWNTLIALYEAWNKPEQAEKWRAELQQTLALKE